MGRAHHAAIARALGRVRRVLTAAAAAQVGVVADGAVGPASGADEKTIVLLACSGGADSVAMVGLAQLARRSTGLEFVVGHVDHGLRDTSAREASLVAGLARSCELEFVGTRLDLARGPGLPARARAARLGALLAQAERCGAVIVALGHTSTDQVETMLLHLARGAGLDGIAAMATVDLPWCRPLLDLSRAETREVATLLGHSFVDDPTNDDRRHPRASIRHDVLPVLARFNPRFEHAFLSASRHARDADEALRNWSDNEVIRLRGVDGYWSVTGLAAVPRAVRMRVLRDICRTAGAELEHLSATVVADMDEAVLAQAAARRRKDPGVRPKCWDLRPLVCVRIDKYGLSVTASPAANH